MNVVNADGKFRRRMIMSIPVVWILFVGMLNWTSMIGRPEAGAADTPAMPQQKPGADTHPAWQQDWPSTPRRNLFLTNLDHFPRDVGTQQQPMRPTDSPAEAKSAPLSTDQNRVAAQVHLADELGKIRLQSIMMYPVPRALVNGQIVGEGDFVGSFRVVRITLGQIVLDKQGVSYPIALQ